MSSAPRSNAELLLAVQLEQAGIPFEREYEFAPGDWCRAHGFLTPKRRLPRKWRADFIVGVHPNTVLVEADGATWTLGRHNHPTSVAKEYERTAAAAILGYRVIRCTTEQVNDGTCLRWIQQALGLEEAA